MPFFAYSAALGVGVRVLRGCPGVTGLCETGDDLEVDFVEGMFFNHTRAASREFPPLPAPLRNLVRLGGNGGGWATGAPNRLQVPPEAPRRRSVRRGRPGLPAPSAKRGRVRSPARSSIPPAR